MPLAVEHQDVQDSTSWDVGSLLQAIEKALGAASTIISVV